MLSAAALSALGTPLLAVVAASDGRLPIPIQHLASDFAEGVQLADVDRDGRLDLIQSSQPAGVRLGDGKGGFAGSLSAVFPVTAPPVLVDLDGNGSLDVVQYAPTAVGSPAGLRAALNDGAGNFPSVVVTLTSIVTPVLRAGDFDHDDHSDIVLGDAYGALRIALSDGTGQFTIGSAFSLSGVGSFGAVTFMDVAEFNGDGHLDVVASDGELCFVALGDGSGSFLSAVQVPFDPGPKSAMLVGDLDGDSRADVVDVEIGPNEVSFHKNLGGAVFANAQTIGTAVQCTQCTLVDLDGSGRLDFVGIVETSQELLAILDPLASANPVRIQRSTGSVTSPSLAVGHLGGDGLLDVLVASGNRLACIHGDEFRTLEGSSVETSVEDVRVLGARDYDGDGDLDALVCALVPSEIRVLRNDGNGLFSTLTTTNMTSTLQAAAAADLDNDGWLDVVTLSKFNNFASLPRFRVHRGLPGGGFAQIVDDFVWFTVNLIADPKRAIDFGYFDSDGLLDVVLVGQNLQSPINTIVFATSGMSWHPGVPPELPIGPVKTLAPVDFDHDGITDLAVGGSNSIVLLRNAGLPTLTVSGSITIEAATVLSIQPIELNGDLFQDLVVSPLFSSDALLSLLGTASGFVVSPTAPVPAESNLLFLERGDVDGDGRDDILAHKTSAVAWHRSLGDGSLEPGRSFAGGFGTIQGVRVNNFAGDSRPDVLTSSKNEKPYLAIAGCRGEVGRFAVSCALPSGTTPEITMKGCAEVGSNIRVEVRSALGAPVAALLIGTGAAATPFPKCGLALTQVLPTAILLPIGPSGEITVFSTLTPQFAGVEFAIQAFLPAIGSPIATNALDVYVAN